MSKKFWIASIVFAIIVLWVSWVIAGGITKAVQPENVGHYWKVLREAAQ